MTNVARSSLDSTKSQQILLCVIFRLPTKVRISPTRCTGTARTDARAPQRHQLLRVSLTLDTGGSLCTIGSTARGVSNARRDPSHTRSVGTSPPLHASCECRVFRRLKKVPSPCSEHRELSCTVKHVTTTAAHGEEFREPRRSS